MTDETGRSAVGSLSMALGELQHAMKKTRSKEVRRHLKQAIRRVDDVSDRVAAEVVRK